MGRCERLKENKEMEIILHFCFIFFNVLGGKDQIPKYLHGLPMGLQLSGNTSRQSNLPVKGNVNEHIKKENIPKGILRVRRLRTGYSVLLVPHSLAF